MPDSIAIDVIYWAETNGQQSKPFTDKEMEALLLAIRRINK